MSKYHGIVLDLEFTDLHYPETLKVFAKRKSKTNPWTLFGVEVDDQQIESTIVSIQQNLKSDQPYYAHFYNDDNLIVIFKDKVIKVTPHKSTWQPIIDYGKLLNIPVEQLDFWPNRFQDEIHYFNLEDFVL